MACGGNDETSGLIGIKLKRRLTYGTILMFNLCTGLGYAIIFPTIWNYIQHLGGKQYMLGLVISSYSLSSLFANPLIGWWSDRSLNTRVILLVTILAEAVGSLLYFIGTHTWVLVVGRLIAGIGAGGGAAVMGDITRTTLEENRTPVLSVVIASRQLGLIIGPAFNLFLSQADFTIFSLPVNKFTSPGLFMAVLWLLLEITVLFAYHNLTALQDDEDVEKVFQNYNSIITGSMPYSDMDNMSNLDAFFTSSYPPYTGNVTPTMEALAPPPLAYSASQPNLQIEWFDGNDDTSPATLRKEEIETIHCQRVSASMYRQSDSSPLRRVRNASDRAGSVSDRMIESAERVIQSVSGSYGNFLDQDSSQETRRKAISRQSSANPSTHYSSDPFSVPDEKSSLLGSMRQGYFRDEIIVLLGLGFISCFAQTVLETIVTPLAQKYYSFSEMDNSFIYLFAGVEVIIVFAAIQFISRRVSDRSFILFGLITLSIATALPMMFVPSAVPGESKTLVYFIVTIVIDLIGIAVITVCSSSLLSKLTSEDSQALFQGLRRSMVSLGCIMGPLWGGSFLFSIYLLFAVPLAVNALITVLFMNSYKKLTTERF